MAEEDIWQLPTPRFEGGPATFGLSPEEMAAASTVLPSGAGAATAAPPPPVQGGGQGEGLLVRLARAYMLRERARLGIPKAEAEATAASDQSMLRRAEAAKIAQEMGFAPAKEQGALDYQKALIEQARAHANQYNMVKPTKQIERTVDLGDRVQYVYTDGTTEEKPKGAAPKVPQSGGGLSKTGIQVVDDKGNPAVWFPKSTGESLPRNWSFATDVRKERAGAVAATSALGNVETIANQVDKALNDLDSINGFMHPIDKGVANSSYKNLLNALAVPWGRLLGDTRISDQDRASYARSVGEPSFFMREMAPELARGRLANLRNVIAEIRAKYGPVLEGSEGLLGAVGGGANLLGHGGSGSGGSGAAPTQTRVINGATYVKVPGGWKRQ